jgi:hypothetical protein
MAKTESTAVNALIDLAVQRPLDFDDDSANMFRAPAATPTAPPPALPRTVTPPPRAASGTQGSMPAVRMITAPPARLTTIPPIGGVAKLPPPMPTGRRAATLPPPRSTGQRAAEGTPTPELFSRSGGTLPPPVSRTMTPQQLQVPAPVPAPPVVASPPPKLARQQPVPKVDQTNDDGWFESTRERGKVEPEVDIDVDTRDDEWSGTMAVRREAFGANLRRVALPAGILLVAAIAVGAYFALATKHTDAAAAPPPPAVAAVAPAAMPAPAAVAPPAMPAPAQAETAVAAPVAAAAVIPAAPAAEPAPAVVAPPAAPAVVAPAVTAAVPHVVNVRFDSQPSGASVMLVDAGKTSFLGTAPVDVAVDASRAYDVVFTLEGHPTQVQHLDATATQHITAMLSGTVAAPIAAAPAVAVTAPPAPAAPAHHHHVALAEPAMAAPRAATASGKGVLMVSSKPPCDIVIDGRPTGLTTPQRAIRLSVGTHKVTLVNAQQNLTKAVTVSIKADQPTKLIQNLLR